MAKNDNNKEIDLNEMAITLEVDSGLVEQVRSGEITHLVMQIDESNQNMILENIDGNPVLVTDEMPTTYHGCYFYNGGDFPYAVKSTLDFLIQLSQALMYSTSWRYVSVGAVSKLAKLE